MFYKNCGKEIENDSNLCETCGEATTPPKKKRVKFKDLSSKEKIKRATIGVIFLTFAFILMFGDVFGSSDKGSNNLGFTLVEFVDRYNGVVDEHLKQDTTEEMLALVKGKLKLDIEYFIPDENYEDTYIADNGYWGYIVIMDNSGEKVRSIAFNFTKDLTEEQLSMMFTYCKWFAEAVKPDMDKNYYTETLTKTIENGETREEGVAYLWRVNDNSYQYEIHYAP